MIPKPEPEFVENADATWTLTFRGATVRLSYEDWQILYGALEDALTEMDMAEWLAQQEEME